jgi:hypothetical protein
MAESQRYPPSLYPIDSSLFSQLRDSAMAGLGQAAFAKAYDEGRAMLLEQVAAGILAASRH